MRLAVHTDDPYVRQGASIAAVMPFALFVGGIGEHVDRLILLGRVAPDEAVAGPAVALPAGVEMVALPWWEDLSRPLDIARALPGSLRAFWRVLDEVDSVLLFGPSPLGLAFAVLARLRRRRVAIGVRMDYVRYITSRRPGRRDLALIARGLDAAWRRLGRRAPAVVVGSALAERYASAQRVLDVTVSLVREEAVAAGGRPFPAAGEPIHLLTVGRVDAEKNPLLLADVVAGLAQDGRDWRLTVCGDGPLLGDLGARAKELGIADRIDLRGFVGPADGLGDLYRGADMFLHVSWTEGVPQVLVEAWAGGTPVVATDVGGVREASGDAAVLIPPGDRDAACVALSRVAADAALRERLVDAGLARARELTLERQSARVADFLAERTPAAMEA